MCNFPVVNSFDSKNEIFYFQTYFVNCKRSNLSRVFMYFRRVLLLGKLRFAILKTEVFGMHFLLIFFKTISEYKKVSSLKNAFLFIFGSHFFKEFQFFFVSGVLFRICYFTIYFSSEKVMIKSMHGVDSFNFFSSSR